MRSRGWRERARVVRVCSRRKRKQRRSMRKKEIEGWGWYRTERKGEMGGVRMLQFKKKLKITYIYFNNIFIQLF